jgi:VWFA-related protein
MTRPLLTVIGVVLVAALGIRAQQQTFRTQTDLVILDVSVLGRNRQPVRDLRAEDFSVTVDGQPQRVTAFRAVDVTEPAPGAAPWLTQSPADVQSNRFPDGRIVLIYLDERVGGDPFSARNAVKAGHAVIDQLGPDDVACVAFALSHEAVQEFTTDRGRLHNAVDRFAPSPYVSLSVVNTLRSMADLLSRVPGRRKVIVYVGAGEPVEPPVLTAINAIGNPDADPNVLSYSQRLRDQYDRITDLVRAAGLANVTIHAIDPIGLTQAPPPGEEPDTLKFPDFHRLLASQTGGRSVVNNNAPAAEAVALLRESSSYYLIGFARPASTGAGRFRRVEVGVKRPNVEVRSRRGYFEEEASGLRQASGPQGRSLLPETGLDVRVWAEPIGVGTNGLHDVGLAIAAAPSSATDAVSEPVTVAYIVTDMSGRQHASGRRDLPGAPDAAEVSEAVRLAPGRYDMVVTATTAITGRQGQVIAELNVDDLAKAPLALSGVMVEVQPGPPNTYRPTTQRAFARSSSAFATVRVFQGKGTAVTEVTVTARVLDASNKTVFESRQALASGQFSAGVANYQLALPLATLSPGEFLLRIEAHRRGLPAVRRDVRFRIN